LRHTYTAEEIGAAVGLTPSILTRNTEKEKGELTVEMENLPKLPKVQFSEPDFKPPIYNVWSFAKKTNKPILVFGLNRKGGKFFFMPISECRNCL
jgi:hypothetical protein